MHGMPFFASSLHGPTSEAIRSRGDWNGPADSMILKSVVGHGTPNTTGLDLNPCGGPVKVKYDLFGPECFYTQ